MVRPRGATRLAAGAGAVVAFCAIGLGPAGGVVGSANHHHVGHHHRAHHRESLASWRHRARTHVRTHFRHLLVPTKKYYGVYVSQAPASMQPVDQVAQETGKHPNMLLFYRDWGSDAAQGVSNIRVDAINNACAAGMLPMLTWESWDTEVAGSNGGPAWSQPDYAPSLIAEGKYDAYIRASAEAIKGANCTIALRLDQEDNSYWYPWGLATQGMDNTAADYVAMWRHVWRIFHQVGANNVVWVWSPNVQGYRHPGLPSLRASYPGHRYVDWVGIDGYIYDNPSETFRDRFKPTFDQLRAFVPNTPWIVAECGVGDAASKPRQLRNLVRQVARHKRLAGLNYFNENKPTSAADWSFEDSGASLAAFRQAIHNPAFAGARAGRPPSGS